VGLFFSYTLNPSVFGFNSTLNPIGVGFSITLNPRGIEFSLYGEPMCIWVLLVCRTQEELGFVAR